MSARSTPRVAPSDPTARKTRTSLPNLIWLFADKPATADALHRIATKVGVDIGDATDIAFDELGPQLPSHVEEALFLRLRRRYDQLLDERLLGNRTSRPIIQPERTGPPRHDDESSDRADPRPVSCESRQGDGDAELRRLLAAARYSLRLAAQEGKQTPHLQRSARSIAEAAEFVALLKADGRSVTAKTFREFRSLRKRLDQLIEHRLQEWRQRKADTPT